MKNTTNVILVGSGKGGIGKTSFAINIIPWLERLKVKFQLYDFDWENTDKSGFKNFYSNAHKLDIHSPRTLDEFFEAGDDPDIDVILADLPAGSGEEIFRWFDEVYSDASDLGMEFTLVAVTTNEAGSVQSTLKWASHLQKRVRYLVALNELAERGSKFEYWHAEPKTEEFTKFFAPGFIRMNSIPLDLESELRNQMLTLDQVSKAEVDHPFLSQTKNRVRAKIAQRALFAELDKVSEFLIPSQS